MTINAKGEMTIYIAWLEETDILVPCQSPWTTALMPLKTPGTSDSHESDSPRETGVHCLGP